MAGHCASSPTPSRTQHGRDQGRWRRSRTGLMKIPSGRTRRRRSRCSPCASTMADRGGRHHPRPARPTRKAALRRFACRMQRAEIRHAIDAQDHSLAVDHELLAAVLQRGFGDPWEALGPIITASGNQAHGATFPLQPDAVAVIFYLMKPMATGGTCCRWWVDRIRIWGCGKDRCAYRKSENRGRHRLKSAHRDHYKSSAHKHCGCDAHRCLKWRHDYPVVTHSAASMIGGHLKTMTRFGEPRGSLGLVRQMCLSGCVSDLSATRWNNPVERACGT
jgi:hypothetical protein